jgi:hypothetical protein
MTVDEAIAAAELVLPGEVTPADAIDPRWQVIIEVGEYIKSDPDQVWSFARRWGTHFDSDVRAAIATCIIEHLVEHHFDRFIDRIEDLARSDARFTDTVRRCWQFGQAEEPTRSSRWQRLLETLRAAG